MFNSYARVRRITVAIHTLLIVWSYSNCGTAEDEYFDYEREHWAFLLPKDWPVPAFDKHEHQHWLRTPIDAFVLEKQLERGSRPAPEADLAML